MSKWHIMPLSPEQQIYAAIDVYVSITIYYVYGNRNVCVLICLHLCVLEMSNSEVTFTFRTFHYKVINFKSLLVFVFCYSIRGDQISQVMFLKLKCNESEQEEEARKFIEEFGEPAYIERQKLL